MERTLGLIMVWLATIFFMLSFAAVTLLGTPLVGMLFLGAMLVGKYNSGASGFFVGGDDCGF